MNNPSQKPERPGWPRLVLRRRDQAVVAAGVAVSLAAMAVAWLWHGPLGRGLVDIDRAEPIAVDFKIDINRADWPELALMPNVGEQLAKRIIADRGEKGPFRELSE